MDCYDTKACNGGDCENCNAVKQIALTYEETALNIGNIVQTKNTQYGNAINNTGEFLELLYPNGIKQEQYAELGVIVRVYDKLKRIANGNQGEENAWQDIAGYGILMCGGEKK